MKNYVFFEHILLHQIHKIMIIKIASYDPFKVLENNYLNNTQSNSISFFKEVFQLANIVDYFLVACLGLSIQQLLIQFLFLLPQQFICLH